MNKEIFKNLQKLLFSNVTTTIIGLISVPIVLKFLSPKEYGLFTLVLSLSAILSIFNKTISSNTVLPLITSSVESKNITREYSILRFYLYSGGIFLFISILVITLVSHFIYNLNFDIVFLFICYLIFYQINTYLINLSLMYKDYSYISLVTVLRNLFRLLIILVLIYFDLFHNALHNVFSFFFSELLLILLVSWRKVYYIILKFKNIPTVSIFNFLSIKELLKKNSFNFFGGNILELKNILIVWFINTFLSTEMVGVYGVIKKIVSQIWSFFKNLEAAVFPYISSMIEKKDNSVSISTINIISFLFSAMLVTVLILLNKYIILYIISSEYLTYSNIFIVGYFIILVSSLQISQKSLLYSLELTNIIFIGAVIEVGVFVILIAGGFVFNHSLTLIIISDIISILLSVLYKKIKLRKWYHQKV